MLFGSCPLGGSSKVSDPEIPVVVMKLRARRKEGVGDPVKSRTNVRRVDEG